MKPALTPEQKQSYEIQFADIIALASPEVQKLWSEGGGIHWVLDMPYFGNNVHQKLSGKLRDDHFNLKRKLDNRTI